MNLIRLAVVHFFAAVGLKLWPAVADYFSKNKKLALLLFIAIFIVLSLLATTGCGLLDTFRVPDISADLYYRNDIKLKINGVTYYGMAAPDRADKYEIKIYPNDDKIDRLIWTTCHRQGVVDKAVKDGGWFKKGDEYYEFEYVPTHGIEDNRACSMEIGSFEKKKKRMGYAFIDFHDEREEISLRANVKCNGITREYFGRSVCQSALGLLQVIEFESPVYTADTTISPECRILKTEDDKRFSFVMPKGYCTFYFRSPERHTNGHRLTHRFSVYGYEMHPPPEEPK